jgi:hypothetical protein
MGEATEALNNIPMLSDSVHGRLPKGSRFSWRYRKPPFRKGQDIVLIFQVLVMDERKPQRELLECGVNLPAIRDHALGETEGKRVVGVCLRAGAVEIARTLSTTSPTRRISPATSPRTRG